MARKDFDQQGVINLRPEDQFVVMQGGQEKRMLAKGLLDYLQANFASSDMSAYVTTTALNAAITNFVTSSTVTTMINAALAGYQPYVAPSAGITDPPASIISLNLLGIGVTAAADAQTDRAKIIAILAALRAHGIILP